MDDSTLRVKDAAGTILFSAKGKWLHPLFMLEDFLAGPGAGVSVSVPGASFSVSGQTVPIASAVLEDKIIGLGAAALLIRMGFKRCHALLLSRLAIPLLEKYGVAYTFDEQVDRLGCMTEDIIHIDDSLDLIHAELSRRAGRAAPKADSIVATQGSFKGTFSREGMKD